MKKLIFLNSRFIFVSPVFWLWRVGITEVNSSWFNHITWYIGLKTSSLWVTLIPIPGLFTNTYNHFLWVGWFLAKNLINFESQLKKPQNQTDESKQWRITWDSLVKLRINTTVSSFLYPILWLDFNRRSKYNVNK